MLHKKTRGISSIIFSILWLNRLNIDLEDKVILEGIGNVMNWESRLKWESGQ